MTNVTPKAPRRGRVCFVAAVIAAMAAGTNVLAASDLRVGVPRLPVAVEPMTAVTPTDLMLVRLVFEGLVAVGDSGEIEPALASGWTVSRDGLSWTFRLREDLHLSTGAAVSADDVVTALSLRLGAEEPPDPVPAWVRPFRGPGRVVQEVRRGDSRGSIQIQLSQPYAPLLAVLAHPALAVAVPTKEAGGAPVGTGPFRIVESKPGGLVLEAVPGSRRIPPRAERLVFGEVADESAALAALAPGGSTDVWIPSAAPSASPAGLQVLSGPSWQLGLLAFRTDQGLFRQKVARQAAALGLDPGPVQAALGKNARPLTGYLPPGAWAARDVPRPFDPGRARRLFAQLGAVDPALTLLVPDLPGGPDAARLAEALRASLEAVGFRPRVRVEPADAALAAMRRGEAELGVISAELPLDDPHVLLRPLLASDATAAGNATNLAFFRSPLVDGMLGRASQLGFRPERLRLYQRLQTYLAEEVPYVPLYVRLQWLVARADVRGLRPEPSGLHRLERAWVEGPLAPLGSSPGAPAAPAAPRLPPLPAPPLPPPVTTNP
jgi:ABC-type transport system substrate-binding protein